MWLTGSKLNPMLNRGKTKIYHFSRYSELCISLAFILRIYHDARSSLCQMHFSIILHLLPCLPNAFSFMFLPQTFCMHTMGTSLNESKWLAGHWSRVHTDPPHLSDSAGQVGVHKLFITPPEGHRNEKLVRSVTGSYKRKWRRSDMSGVRKVSAAAGLQQQNRKYCLQQLVRVPPVK